MAGDDTLTLYAPGNISVEGDIGATDALEGLTIGGVTVAGSTNLPNDVTFHGSITLDGDLRINASALVTFDEQVTLHGGGSVVITGGHPGHLQEGAGARRGRRPRQRRRHFLEGDEIDFQGGTGSCSAVAC